VNCLDCGKITSIKSKARCISCANRHRNITHRGDKSYFWKGKDASYVQKHKWINQILGQATFCNEPNCSKTSNFYEWGNISGKYLRDVSDYRSMCHSCNIKMDNRKRDKNGVFIKRSCSVY